MNPDGNSDFILSNGCHASLLLVEAHEVAVVGGEGETVLAQEEPSGKGAAWHRVVVLVAFQYYF